MNELFFYFFLILIFSPHIALICYLIYQVFCRKFSSLPTAAALAIILANLTLVYAYNYFFTDSTTIRVIYLSILLCVFVYIGTLLIHQLVNRHNVKQFVHTTALGALILVVTAGITLVFDQLFRYKGF